MKANKFVEKFGWDAAKEALTLACDKLEHVNYENHAVLISDLKRLVESHELVEIYTRRFNGDAEWFFVSEYCKKNRISPFFSENYNKASGIYKQAILDVESCQ